VDDAGYLRALIEEIDRRFAVDRKRVNLMGNLIGGFLAYRMACGSADLIAGIASLAGTTFLDADRCQPSEPVNILQIHPTHEWIFLYLGGTINTSIPLPIPSNLPPYPGAVRNIQLWAAYNGASGPVTDSAPSLDLAAAVAGLDTVVTRYTSCPPGGNVELWSIVGASHLPTPSPEYTPRIIDWLLAHPKP
jgi:polyhydroxybutyrate depolymerase